MNSTLAETSTRLHWMWNNCKKNDVNVLLFYVEWLVTFPLSCIATVIDILAIYIILKVQKKNPTSVPHLIILITLLVTDVLYAFSNSWHFGFRKLIYQAIHGDAIYMVDMRIQEPISFFLFATVTKMFQTLRNLLIALISIERFIVVTWPLKSKAICTKRNAKICVSLCIIISALRLQWGMYAGEIWYWVINPCSGKWQIFNDISQEFFDKYAWYTSFMDYYLSFFTALLPASLITGGFSIALLISIKVNLKRRAELMQKAGESEENQKIMRSARTVLIIAFTTFILQSPQAIDRIISLLNMSKALWAFLTITRNFSDLLTAIDLVIDFFATICINTVIFWFV